MYPEILSIGPFTVHSYGFIMAVVVVVGYYFLIKTSRYRDIPEGFINYLFTGAVIWGVIGARIFYILISFESIINRPMQAFALWDGGLVFSGGLLGGVGWAAYASKKRKVKFLDAADAAAPVLALGYAIQRIGCFLGGHCYGRITASPIGVVFPRGGHVHLDQVKRGLIDISQSPLPVHPTQLYSVFGVGLISFVLYRFLKARRMKSGSVFALYLALYGAFRFGVEFLRGDFRGVHILFFTPTQWVAAVSFAAGVFILYKRRSQFKSFIK